MQLKAPARARSFAAVPDEELRGVIGGSGAQPAAMVAHAGLLGFDFARLTTRRCEPVTISPCDAHADEPTRTHRRLP